MLTGHPGGRFVIEKNIGREVGKFFYGAYTVESTSMHAYSHSKYALKVLRSMVIAKLTSPEVYMRQAVRGTAINEEIGLLP